MGQSELLDITRHRCPVALLVDMSCYISENTRSALFSGVKSFAARLSEDEGFDTLIEPAIITFGGNVEIRQDFISSDCFSMSAFEAAGAPCLGRALDLGNTLIENRTKFYSRHNMDFYKPWLFLISSGMSDETSSLQIAAIKSQEADLAGKLSYFIVGVPGANMELLRDIASPFNPPLKMKENCFSDLFVWLISSMHRVHDVNAGAGYLASPMICDWAASSEILKV